MKELYIDFDGVILDTIGESYKMMDEAGIDKKNYEDCFKFYSNLDWVDMIKKSPEINDSMNCIKKIMESGKFRVSILTHITTLEEGIAKINYIRRRLKDITVILVPKKISKTKMVHSEGSILVDDYAGNLREWENAKGIGIRFSTKLNGKGFLVIDKLDKILELDI